MAKKPKQPRARAGSPIAISFFIAVCNACGLNEPIEMPKQKRSDRIPTSKNGRVFKEECFFPTRILTVCLTDTGLPNNMPKIFMSNILLVEDNELNRDMLSRRLQRKGFTVAMAVDGQEGVDMAASTAYDLILMDMSLPILDGWAATRQIRSSGNKVPIIALTAHAMDGDEQAARDAGCDDYDTKPVDLPRLLEKMERLLNQ